MSGVGIMINQFKNPDSSYKGTDFWMINDKLKQDELERQLVLMHQKGIKSVLVRTFSGLISDYPGENFLKSMHVIHAKAKELGINILLQAKYMPECIPDITADLAISHIIPTPVSEVCPSDNVIYKSRETAYIAKMSKSILDIFDSNAVASYIKICYNDMWESFRDEYGKSIISVWVDEPAYGRTNLPWPHNFEKIFREKYGYSVSENIYKLYINDIGFEKVRYDYWSLLEELIENNYYKQLQKWCRDNNLKASGHLFGEDRLQVQLSCSCGVMPFYKYFDIPGIDVLTLKANWNKEPVKQKHGDEMIDLHRIYLTPIQIMSAVKQFGNDEHVLCEMYGASTQNMTFKNQKYLFDYYASFGVNHRSVHGMFYSLKGRRKRGYPPHINYYQPYWDSYDSMLEYVARVSEFVRFGESKSNVLVLHPLNHCRTIYQGNLLSDRNKEISRYDIDFHSFIKYLKTIHCDFDFGDSATIRDIGTIDTDNKFRIGKMAYSTVILPNISLLTRREFELLKEFSERGGNIICWMNRPTLVDAVYTQALDDINMTTVTNFMDLKNILDKDMSYSLNGTDMASHIIVNHREDENTDYFMLMNTDCSAKKHLVLRLNGEKRAYLWDGVTGNRDEICIYNAIGESVLNIDIDKGSSLLLSFEKGRCGVKDGNSLIIPVRTMDMSKNWTVERNQKNVLLLEYCHYKTDGEFSNAIPALGVNEILTQNKYSGKVTMEFDFYTDCPLKCLKLAVENPENCRIMFNGEPVCNKPDGFYLAKQFELIKLPDVCKTGKNTITIETDYTALTGISSGLESIFSTSSGNEIENIYLLGDFKVSGIMEHNLNGCMRFNRNFVLTSENDNEKFFIEDISAAGYPFYSGTITFKNTFTLPGEGFKKCALYLKELNGAVAKVYINQKYAGIIHRGEAVIDFTHLSKCGENTIEIKISNTLRNLLGPHHRQIGERGNAFGDTAQRIQGCYGYFDEPWLCIDTLEKDWTNLIDKDSAVWTSSYNLLSFGADGVEIRVE